ncbi:hypothetical protein V493_06384 [Pseudogymnoascus sp. VKM F-4281 (FW-2241)]|nr:hypothetical protein V493_06384 [Pseudogymnoascus sp. VKM F-4281 (FW-2241)]
MDPLSIVASACGIAGLCGNIIVHVSQFIVDSREVSQSINDFRTNITILEAVLYKVQVTVEKSPKQLPFAQKEELEHWKEIDNVLEACRESMERLKNMLPEPFKNGKPTVLVRKQLEMCLKSDVVVQIRGHITTYTQLLQLSLATITLGSTWDTQRSHDIMRFEIEKLTREMQDISIVWRQQGPQRLGCQIPTPDSDNGLTLREMQADKNFEAWRCSVEHLVAAAATLYEPDEQSIANREGLSSWGDPNEPSIFHESNSTGMADNLSSVIERGGGIGDTAYQDSGLGVSDDGSDWDLDPQSTNSLSAEILQCQIAEIQEDVTKYVNNGLYFQAERDQKKGIELRDLLEKTHSIPFSDRADVEETLANIYMQQKDTKSAMARAKDILQRLLKQEIYRNLESNNDESRQWRLYHKLGIIYIETGSVDKAKVCAIRALDGREKSNSQPDLIIESVHLLEKAYQLNQDFAEARAVKIWAEKKYSQHVNTRASVSTVSTNDTVPNLMIPGTTQWCKENRFDVDSRNFSFDTPNADGKTPLHVAVVGNKLEILNQIADCVATLESRDFDDCTALLLACGERNRRTTKALIDHGAKLDVHDKYHNTPLHRAQDATGGSEVAKLLLSHPSHAIDINAKNCYDKTALHLACELENEAMVSLLIDYNADINCHGPHGCTPLHVAIDYRRPSIVKILLHKGANTLLTDADKRDAMKAAKTTKRGSPEIKRMLQEHEIKMGWKRKQS